MMLVELSVALDGILAEAAVVPPPGTVFHGAGKVVLLMAGSYVRDGSLFLENGDRINGTAALTYACGWLDAGVFLGLVRTSTGAIGVASVEDAIGEGMRVALLEKVSRYRRLLQEALDAVEIGGARGCEIYAGIEALLTRVRGILDTGDTLAAGSDHLNALSHYSYGHAWLDAGVRTGLLRVAGRADLFTI